MAIISDDHAGIAHAYGFKVTAQISGEYLRGDTHPRFRSPIGTALKWVAIAMAARGICMT